MTEEEKALMLGLLQRIDAKLDRILAIPTPAPQVIRRGDIAERLTKLEDELRSSRGK